MCRTRSSAATSPKRDGSAGPWPSTRAQAPSAPLSMTTAGGSPPTRPIRTSSAISPISPRTGAGPPSECGARTSSVGRSGWKPGRGGSRCGATSRVSGDEQELQQRLAQAERRAARPSPREAAAGRVADRTPEASRDGAERAAGTARVDLDAGIAGVLLESGEAPYRRRSGEPLTPFIRLDRGEGRPLDIWGVGLPEALARSGAGVGDRIQGPPRRGRPGPEGARCA